MSRMRTSRPRLPLNEPVAKADPWGELPTDFSRKLIKHLKSLTREQWGVWPLMYREFPDDGEERIHFMDRFLRDALAPNGFRFFDLNKYRGWVLTLVVVQLLDRSQSEFGYRLPDELRTLIEHLSFFRNNRAYFPVQHRCLHRLGAAEFRFAVDKILSSGVENRRIPSTAHTRFITADGGNGHALRIAVAKDGAELIVPLTEPASRAFGSPHWCTAYTDVNKSHFYGYFKLGPLVIAIDRAGKLEQAHPTTGEFRDADNRPAPLDCNVFSQLLSDQPRLFDAAVKALLQNPPAEAHVAVGAIASLMKLTHDNNAMSERATALFVEMVRKNLHFLSEHDVRGFTLLHHLIQEGPHELVRAVLTLPETNINQLSAKAQTPLHLAVQYNRFELVKELLTHPSIAINAKTTAGVTPLHVSIGTAQIVKCLLAAPGINANAKDCNGRTPLIEAICRQKDVSALLLLIAPGLDITRHIDRYGNTALHLAAAYSHASVVERLVSMPGTNFKAVNKKGHTPLHVAAERGDVAMITRLVEHCPDCRSIKDRQGKIPLDYAACHTENVELRNMLLLPGGTMH